MIAKGDWVRVTGFCEGRGRIGEVIWIHGVDEDVTQFQVDLSQFLVDLFGEPLYVGMYIGWEIEKLNEMEVLAEASK